MMFCLSICLTIFLAFVEPVRSRIMYTYFCKWCLTTLGIGSLVSGKKFNVAETSAVELLAISGLVWTVWWIRDRARRYLAALRSGQGHMSNDNHPVSVCINRLQFSGILSDNVNHCSAVTTRCKSSENFINLEVDVWWHINTRRRAKPLEFRYAVVCSCCQHLVVF